MGKQKLVVPSHYNTGQVVISPKGKTMARPRVVSKYEFITYGRNHEQIKATLDELARQEKPAE